jgi:Dolichyl-phosphate-mannose-protein mannosyltransferase/F5/8 type C domain
VPVTWPTDIGSEAGHPQPATARPASLLRSIAIPRVTLRRTVAPAALLTALFVLVRYWVACSPDLSETYYDEALTGLMSLTILRGVPQVFYWGQPYLGAEDAYLVAGAFSLFGPSTFVLRMTVGTAAVLWAWAVWSIARRVVGEPFGLVAGLYLAVPPIFLTYIQLSDHGETVSLTLGCLVLASAAALLDERVGRRGRAWAWGLLGVAGGLGWWASQMMGMFLLAAALTLVVACPRVLRTRGPYAALGLFFLASAPFWVWNVRHEWATFWHLATWGGPTPRGLGYRASMIVGPLLTTFHNYFWDGHAVDLPRAVDRRWWLVLWAFYGPAAVVAGAQLGVWAARAWRRTPPWREPLDLVVLAFCLTVAAHLATWFGVSGVLRYSMTFYATVPILGAVALGRVAHWGRAGWVVAAAAALLVLGYNGLTNVLFVSQTAGVPRRPVDSAIRRMEELGVSACYADSRIAQVIAFESRERIECADFYGYRNFAFLQRVDAIEDPSTVAIVTHQRLRSPSPDDMGRMLALIGGRPERAAVGDYVIFHHIVPPDDRVRPISPTGWRATASTDPQGAARAFDRQVWTGWTTQKRDGGWYRLDLGRPYTLAQLSLLAAPDPANTPVGLRVETSLDGRAWAPVVDLPIAVSGVHWWKGHPRVDESGRVQIRLQPRLVRYVRLTNVGDGPRGSEWSIGELFAYEAAGAPWIPPGAAVTALAEAQAELAHYMDDPGGPHPRRAPVTTLHRRAQVDWRRVFAAADRALAEAPEWEEAHHLYGLALALYGWLPEPDEMIVRARADRAWLEVVRWTELAETVRPEFWRSGRAPALAEARRELGLPAGGASLAGPSPATTLSVRFGRELELTGIDLPVVVRAGETTAVRYHWHALSRMRQDYWAFVHVDGSQRELNQDHALGPPLFGTSHWEADEQAVQSVPLAVPADTPPGPYQVKVGVWLPQTGKRLRVTETDLPHVPRFVEIGTVTVVAPDTAGLVATPSGS